MSKILDENPTMLIALAFMLVAATLIVHFACMRVLRATKAQLKTKTVHRDPSEYVSTKDAAMFPITGSCVLFGLYLAIKFIPKEILNSLLSGYLVLIGISALATAVRPTIGASIPIGIVCCVVGIGYWVSREWILNNILAIGIAIAAVEHIALGSSKASIALLCGLFLYDIFWVFGTEVMVTVAQGIQGPIKIMFPQNIFGDHEKKSILGLGDIVIPGFFVSQMMRMSLLWSNGKSTAYYTSAIVAYFLSLVNTMAVMVFFEAAQPALLYIVPWLLITAAVHTAVNGRFLDWFKFDEQEALAKCLDALPHEAEKKEEEQDTKTETEQSKEEPGYVAAILDAALAVFGQDKETLEELKKQKKSA